MSPEQRLASDTDIVRVQGRRLDVEYLRRQAPVIGVTDLLDRALAAELT